MIASRIEARAVFKVVAIVLVAIGVALLLEHVIVEVRTTIRWLFAAVFLALALSPPSTWSSGSDPRAQPAALARGPGRLPALLPVLGFLVLEVIPPIVREIEQLGAQLPTYVKDFEDWAEGNEQFRELNDKYDITKLLSQEASQVPARLGDVAGGVRDITVGLLNNLVEAVVVLTLSYFLLLDGGQAVRARGLAPARPASRARAPRRRADRADRALLRLGQPHPRGARRGLHLALAGAARRRPRGAARGAGRALRPRAADRVHDRRRAGRRGRGPARLPHRPARLGGAVRRSTSSFRTG